MPAGSRWSQGAPRTLPGECRANACLEDEVFEGQDGFGEDQSDHGAVSRLRANRFQRKPLTSYTWICCIDSPGPGGPRLPGRCETDTCLMRPRVSAISPRLAPRLLPLILVAAVAGCGRVAPVVAPGSLTVTSTPAGAAILLNGTDTGTTTPHTFADLAANVYEVSVALPGWVPQTPSQVVDLQPLDVRAVDFPLSQTGVAVVSTPAGARIFADGEDTGLGDARGRGGPDRR